MASSAERINRVVSESVLGGASVTSVQDELYSVIMRDDSYENAKTYSFKPTSVINNQRLNFEVPKQYEDNFIELNTMRLSFKVKLVDKDGKVPPAEDNTAVAPIVNFPSAMIGSVNLFLNESQISTSGNSLLPYWSYTNILLGESMQKKITYRDVFGFYEDSKWDAPIQGASGWDKRRRLFGRYKDDNSFEYYDESFTFVAPLLSDFTGCLNRLLPKISVRVEVNLTDPGFYLNTLTTESANAKTKGYRLNIEEAALVVDLKEMNPSLGLEVERHLRAGENVVYHTKRVDCKRLTLQAKQTSFSTDSIKQSETTPDRLLLFLVNHWAVDTAYGISPMYATRDIFPESAVAYDFRKRTSEKLNSVLEYVNLTLNNESQEICSMASSPDDLAKHHFLALQETYGAGVLPGCVAVDYEDFQDGKYFMAYDLTKGKQACLSGVNVRQPTKPGNLKLQMQFSKELPSNAYLYVIAEYHSSVTVDKNRNITYKFLD